MNTSNNSSFASCDSFCWKKTIDQLNDEMVIRSVPLLLFMCLLMIIGIPGNLIVIWIYSVRKVRTTANCFVITLACVDLTTCVVIHPYIISKLFNSYNQQQVLTCKLFEFLIHFMLSVSAIVLLVVAVDRYLAICKPFHFLKYQKHATSILIATFAIGIVVSLPLLEFYGKRMIEVPTPVQGTIKGYLCDFSDRYQGSLPMASFGMVMFVNFSVIVLGMMILYFSVARTAYRRRLRHVSPKDLVTDSSKKNEKHAHKRSFLTSLDQGSTSKDGIVSPSLVLSRSSDICSVSTIENVSLATNMFTASVYKDLDTKKIHQPILKNCNKYVQKDTNVSSENHQRRKDYAIAKVIRQEKWQWKNESIQCNKKYTARLKAAKILFLVTAVFLLSWLPFWVIRFCWLFAPSYMAGQSETGKSMETFFMHLFYLNNAANPVIYTIINKNFRAECGEYWHKCRLRIEQA